MAHLRGRGQIRRRALEHDPFVAHHIQPLRNRKRDRALLFDQQIVTARIAIVASNSRVFANTIGSARLLPYCGLIPIALMSLPNLSVSFRMCSANSSGVPPTAIVPRETRVFEIVDETSALLISMFKR